MMKKEVDDRDDDSEYFAVDVDSAVGYMTMMSYSHDEYPKP